MFCDPDIPVFVSDFGVDMTVGGVTVRGLFEADYREAFGVSGVNAAVLVSASVVADQDTAVVVNSTAYVVRAIEPDSAGFKRLLLEES